MNCLYCLCLSHTFNSGDMLLFFTETPCDEMEELKCLTCTSTSDDGDCLASGELEGCDEDVSTWSHTEGTTSREKWGILLQCTDYLYCAH